MRNNIFKQVMSIILSISILSQGLLANVKTSPEQDREELIEYLQSQQEVYKAQFDKEMILESLDYDVDKIIDFVSNKIVYQAYDGILRGVEGTLIGRAGNAHDQALTLASMLNDADVEAQIMVGELNDAQIEELNEQIASPVLPKLDKGDKNTLPIIMKKMLQNITINEKKADKKLSNIYTENARIAKTIYEHIPQKSLDEGKISFNKALYESTKRYRWVRYRLSKDSPWIETHPVYQKAQHWKLSSNSIEADSTNPDDLQKLSIELWIENSENKKYLASDKWTSPVANLIDKPITLTFSSNAILKDNFNKNLKKVLDKGDFFFLSINNELSKSTKIFDKKGNIFQANYLNTLDNSINKASSFFDNALTFEKKPEKSENKKSIYITKVWLKFILEKPHIENHIIMRTLFEGNALNKEDNIATKLFQNWDITVLPTSPMTQYHKDKNSNNIINSLSQLTHLNAYLSNIKISKKGLLEKTKSLIKIQSLAELEHIREQFNRYKDTNTQVSYLNEASLLASRQGIKYKDKKLLSYKIKDIISSNRYSFEQHKEKYVANRLLSIKHGVWETLFENSKLLKSHKVNDNTSAFDTLSQQNIFGITHLDNNEITLDSNINTSDNTWWNIDVKSGSTLGIISLDEGNAGGVLSGYHVLLFGISLAIIGTIIASYDCSHQLGRSMGCCIGYNSSLAVGALVFGELLGALFAISTSLGFGISGVVDTINSDIFDASKFCPKAKPNEKWWERQLYPTS